MIIYRVTNTINNKWYIGKDAKNYSGYLGSGLAIKSAIKKYGKENFIKETIETCKDLKELAEREVFWIEKTNAVNDINSYNLANGGQGGDLSMFIKNRRKVKWTEERRQKMKDKISGNKNGMYGKKLSAEHRQKLSEANKNRDHSGVKWTDNRRSLSVGKTASSFTKNKMSESRKKPLKITNIITGTIKIFNSTKEAIDFYKVRRNKICENKLDGYNIEKI